MAIVSASGEVRLFEPPVKPKITKQMKLDALSSGLSKEEAKKVLDDKLAEMKADYEKDMADWKAVPALSQEEKASLKADLQKKTEAIKEKKAKCKQVYAEETAKAKEIADELSRKLALSKAKDKYRNTLLDLKEEKRVTLEAYNKATLSLAQIYEKKTRVKTWGAIVRDRHLYLMLLPFVIWYILFNYVPYYGILIAFKDFRVRTGIWGSPWADYGGFYYFYQFFNDHYFFKYLKNTLLINVYSLIFTFWISIAFALLLNELRNKLFKTTVQTISYLPHFVSAVVIAGLVITFCRWNGLLNNLYSMVVSTFTGQSFEAVSNTRRDLLSFPEYFRTIYLTMGVWQGMGFGSIIYTSALAGIDQELYEAAKIDGATRWKQMLHITLPGIFPTVAIMLIMQVGKLLSLGYETILLLGNDLNKDTSEVLSLYSYRKSFDNPSGVPEYSYSTAIALFNGIISLILVSASNKLSNKLGDVGLW